MDQEKINSIVQKAEKALERVKDETLKAETYKIILTELLRNEAGGNSLPTVNNPHTIGAAKQALAGGEGPAAKVAAWASTSKDLLSEIFEFGETSVTVKVAQSTLPKKISDAQRLLANLKLSAEKIGYDTDEVPAKDLIDIFDDHGCKDGNAAKNLKSSEYVIAKGGKNAMKAYKIRYSGLGVARDEIRNVIGVVS